MTTQTPNLGLNKISRDALDWFELIDDNWDLLDAAFDALDGSTAVQYVSTTGNDANTGTSWGQAKLTIKGAIDALPTNGGKIYYETGVWAQPDHTKGLWLSTAGTSGYITSKPFVLEGAKFAASLGLGAGGPAALINVPAGGPGLKWDATAGDSNLQLFRYVAMNECSTALKAGISDGGSRATGFGAQGKSFEYCQFRAGTQTGYGPTVDLGSNVFWWWFKNTVLIANETYARSDDRSCNIKADPGISSTPGLIYLDGCILGGGGGVRVYPGRTGEIAWSVHDCSSEGTTGGAEPITAQPVFEIAESPNGPGVSYNGYAEIFHIEQADSNANPTVKVYSGVRPDTVVVNDVKYVSGPATLLGGRVQTVDTAAVLNTPGEQNQFGMMRSKYYGPHDAGRRSAGLAAARYVNLATQDTSTWGAKTGSATVTTGQKDIAGGTNAAKLSTGAGNQTRQIYRATPGALAIGDWYVGGAWVRTDTTVSAALAPLSLSVTAGGSGTWVMGTTRNPADDSPIPRQQWEWVAIAGKITAGSGGLPEVIFQFNCSATGANHFCFPVFFRVPASDGWSDAEIYDLMTHLAPWSHTAAAGQAALNFGQSLHIPNSYIDLAEITTPTAPAAASKRAFVYVDVSGGKQRLMCLFDSGAAQVMATEP